MSVRWPDYVKVIYAPRGWGKTSYIMEEIHEYAVQNRTAEIAVICANRSMADLWIRNWRDRYPALNPPRVLCMGNLLPIRGYRFEKLYFEDIEIDLDGIYSERVEIAWPSLAWAREPEMVFTYSPLEISYDWPYDPEPTEEELQAIEDEKTANRLAAIRNRLVIWKSGKSGQE